MVYLLNFEVNGVGGKGVIMEIRDELQVILGKKDFLGEVVLVNYQDQ